MNVKVLGAGPTGSIAAIALASLGNEVLICDPLTTERLIGRSRAYAITHSSRRLLQSIHLWEPLLPYMVPFTCLSIHDRVLDLTVSLHSSDLLPSNKKYGSIGWIVDHKPLMELLLNRLTENKNISSRFGSFEDPGNSLEDLIIGADGPRSPSREFWNISTSSFLYKQGCLTAKVLLRGVPTHCAHEIFRPEGPLAILPMGEDVFQIVWSAPLKKCQERISLRPSVFLDSLAAVLPENIQPDSLLDLPSCYPLGFLIAHRFRSENFLLVGESAHRFHPVGGQGLNICWRDVHALMNVMKKNRGGDKGTFDIPRTYSLIRRPDVLLMGLITDLTVRLFSTKSSFLLIFRIPLMLFLRRSRRFRTLLLRIMTDGPTTIFRSSLE